MYCSMVLPFVSWVGVSTWLYSGLQELMAHTVGRESTEILPMSLNGEYSVTLAPNGENQGALELVGDVFQSLHFITYLISVPKNM